MKWNKTKDKCLASGKSLEYVRDMLTEVKAQGQQSGWKHLEVQQIKASWLSYWATPK